MKDSIDAQTISPLNIALNTTLAFATLYSFVLSGIFFFATIKKFYDTYQDKKTIHEYFETQRKFIALTNNQSRFTDALISKTLNEVNASIFNARCKTLSTTTISYFFALNAYFIASSLRAGETPGTFATAGNIVLAMLVTIPLVLATANKAVKASRLFSSRKKTSSQNQLSPSVRYFIEKANGNTQLSALETEALHYVKNNDTNTPPDQYFRQLLSEITRAASDHYGIIPPHINLGFLADYENKAEEYIHQLQSTNKKP